MHRRLWPFAITSLAIACGAGETPVPEPAAPGADSPVVEPATVDDVAADEETVDDEADHDECVRSPTEVATITDAVEVVAGFDHTCARHAAGNVSCWGAGYAGQLGPDVTSSVAPVAIAGVEGAEGLVASAAHTCARLADSRVMCWGDSRFDQLGAHDPNAHGPVVVAGASARFMDGERTTTCAIDPRGRARCWGESLDRDYARGQAYIDPLEGARRVRGASAIGLGDGYGCILSSGGGVSCWGQNEFGQLGRSNDDDDGYNDAPLARVAGLPPAAEIAVAASHVCARTQDGEVFCWGFDSVGEVTSDEPGLAHVPNVHHAAQIETSASLSCARLEDGRVTCWGFNGFGAFGSPDDREDSGPSFVPGIHDAIDLSAGDEHVCAVLANGHVMCWGRNNCGEVGVAPIADTECRYDLDEPAGSEGGVGPHGPIYE